MPSIYPPTFLFTLFILLPNLLCLLCPPKEIPAVDAKDGQARIVILVMEWLGRAGVFFLPLFWKVPEINLKEGILLSLMLLCLLSYYGCWYRYLRGGCSFRLLFTPLAAIPIPMALFPVVYFFCCALLLDAPPVLLSAVLFAAGHILESWRNYRLLG